MTATVQAGPASTAVCQWTNQYSVGVMRLDEQHRKLFEILASLQQAMLAKKGDEIIKAILDELARYTKTHFACEEGYLRMYSYPELETHKREHEQFVNKIREFQAQLAQGQGMLSLQVFRFLLDWLKSHIQGSDKKYGAFLQAKGVR